MYGNAGQHCSPGVLTLCVKAACGEMIQLVQLLRTVPCQEWLLWLPSPQHCHDWGLLCRVHAGSAPGCE